MNYNEWLTKSVEQYVKEREKFNTIGEMFGIAEKIFELGNTDEIFEDQTAHLDLDQTEMVRENLGLLTRWSKNHE